MLVMYSFSMLEIYRFSMLKMYRVFMLEMNWILMLEMYMYRFFMLEEKLNILRVYQDSVIKSGQKIS